MDTVTGPSERSDGMESKQLKHFWQYDSDFISVQADFKMWAWILYVILGS